MSPRAGQTFQKKLEKKIKQNNKIFCAFLTLGYKSLSQTKSLIRLLNTLGTDVVELGIPFSDPLADGPVIQASSEYALKKGIRPQDAFGLVKKLRQEGVGVPIIFFSYFNPILRMGISNTVRKLKDAGFDGVLCPDLPPDEGETLEQELVRNGLCPIHLIAPTTSRERMKKILAMSRGFIYYVSRRGVTGVRESLDEELAEKVKQIKRFTSLPVLVGFGVSGPSQVREINRTADGVIVGSAIIEAIQTCTSGALRRFLERMIEPCRNKGKKDKS
ncbi:MAG: tryptophan synthase subunit alpha [Candidatus Omnitrophica bacterium]|nr:tryptophan synthase subunit alpha [Candidatus Omnitrophota bacterium]